MVVSLTLIGILTALFALILYIVFHDAKITITKIMSVVVILTMVSGTYWAINRFAGYPYTSEPTGEFRVISIAPINDRFYVTIVEPPKDVTFVEEFIFGDVDTAVRLYSVERTSENEKKYRGAMSKLRGKYKVFSPKGEEEFEEFRYVRPKPLPGKEEWDDYEEEAWPTE